MTFHHSYKSNATVVVLELCFVFGRSKFKRQSVDWLSCQVLYDFHQSHQTLQYGHFIIYTVSKYASSDLRSF